MLFKLINNGKVEKKVEVDISNLTPNDFCYIASFHETPEKIKKNHKEAYRKDKKYYLKLKKKLKFSDYKLRKLRDILKEDSAKIYSSD